MISANRSRPTAIDLFAGAGGLSEGLLAAGINVAVAVEGHPHPALTHAFNHPESTVVCGDIREISIGFLKKLVKKKTGRSTVDLIAGGPPCQGFSPAGKQDKHDPRNKLFEEFLRIVEGFKPRMFLFENVPGFAKLYGSESVDRLTKSFRDLGYQMHAIDTGTGESSGCMPVLNAAWYGVPQLRKRFLLIGWIEGKIAEPFSWPQQLNFANDLDGDRGHRPYVTIEEAIGDLSFLTGGLECNGYRTSPTSAYQRERRKNTKHLFNHLATKHRKETVNMFRKLSPGKTIRSLPEEHRSGKQRMRRFTKRGVASAILALPDDYVHYQRHRIHTVREMARLQSFDDDYVFLGKRTTSDLNRRIDVPQYTQVGNAVPPLLAKAIGKSLLASLGHSCVDLRNLQERRRRHAWIRGSSGFHGYTLSKLAHGQIDLRNVNGDELELPISEEDPLVAKSCTSAVAWSRTRKSRRNFI